VPNPQSHVYCCSALQLWLKIPASEPLSTQPVELEQTQGEDRAVYAKQVFTRKASGGLLHQGGLALSWIVGGLLAPEESEKKNPNQPTLCLQQL
jgi:hypothetical protein